MWEYRIESWWYSGIQLRDKLDYLGRDGWELVSVRECEFFFKRKVDGN